MTPATEALRLARDALSDAMRAAHNNVMWRPDQSKAGAAIAAIAALAQQPAASGEPATLQLWCDTCEGTGKVHQEHQRGVIGSGGTFDCPDCDGNGFVKTSRYVLAATAKPAPAPLTEDPWHKLYRRAINEANGLTNYVEDRPELRSAERRLTAIEAEARMLAAALTAQQGEQS